MVTGSTPDLKVMVEEGLKIMYNRLLNKAIQENDDLVTRNEQGDNVRIKATELKARLK